MTLHQRVEDGAIRSWILDHGTWAHPPRRIYLIVNSSCNAHCIMCDIGLRNRESSFYRNFIQEDRAVLSLAAVEKLATEIRSHKPRYNINGVEPLMHKEIASMVALLKRMGSRVQIITNGLLLEEAAEDLVRSGLDILRVSIDGLEVVHDRIRGDGAFQRAYAGLEAVFRCKQGYRRTKPRVILNYTITDRNYDHLTEFAGEMLSSGLADGIQFKQMFFVTEEMSAAHNTRFGDLGRATPTNLGQVQLDRIDPDVLWEQYRGASRMGKAIDFWPELRNPAVLRAYYHNPEYPLGRKVCSTPWQSTHVLPNGDTMIRSRCFEYKTGNVLTQQFATIWHGERYREFRRQLLANGGFPVCSRCCGVF